MPAKSPEAKDHKKAYDAVYRLAHKVEAQAYGRDYYKKNPEKFKDKEHPSLPGTWRWPTFS